jgi:hypothetical protein
MVCFLPNEERKGVTMRKCKVCAANKLRKATSVMCLSCDVGVWKTPYFTSTTGKKIYQTGTQKFNIIPGIYQNTTVINYLLHLCNKIKLYFLHFWLRFFKSLPWYW